MRWIFLLSPECSFPSDLVHYLAWWITSPVGVFLDVPLMVALMALGLLVISLQLVLQVYAVVIEMCGLALKILSVTVILTMMKFSLRDNSAVVALIPALVMSEIARLTSVIA